MAGLRWSAQVLSWASTLLVVRLLHPADYGIAGLATTVVSIASILAEFGLGTSIITLQRVTPRQLAQLHTLAPVTGLVVGALITGAAPVLAALLKEPALRQVLPVLSVVFFLDGLRVVPTAVLLRRLDYAAAGAVDLLRSAVSAAVALALAVAGKGYWAMVLALVGGSAAASAWLTWREPSAMAWPRRSDLSGPLRHAWHVVAGGLAWVLYRSSDFLVTGRVLGATALGYYAAGWNLASLPGEKLGTVITAVTAPFFRAIQSDRLVLRHYFLFVTKLLALILAPALTGILLVSDLAVPLILGERWLPSVQVLRPLCVYALMQSVMMPVGQIFNVTGRARFGMWVGIVALVVYPISFYVGARAGGIIGVAWTWVLVYPFFAAATVAVAGKTLEFSGRHLIRSLAPAVVCSGIMSLAVVGWRMNWASEAIGVGRLALLCVGGAAVYLASLWTLFPGTVREVRDTLLKPSISPTPSPA